MWWGIGSILNLFPAKYDPEAEIRRMSLKCGYILPRRRSPKKGAKDEPKSL